MLFRSHAKRIAELEEQDECIECGKHLFQSDPILGKDRVYRLGTIFFDPGSPGGREEPPEPACAIPICQDCLEEDEKVDLLKERISKQHAALKKLGKAKRERGKALVEERTWHFVMGGADECIVPDEEYPIENDCYCVDEPKNCPAFDYLKKIAREQLRVEGKL